VANLNGRRAHGSSKPRSLLSGSPAASLLLICFDFIFLPSQRHNAHVPIKVGVNRVAENPWSGEFGLNVCLLHGTCLSHLPLRWPICGASRSRVAPRRVRVSPIKHIRTSLLFAAKHPARHNCCPAFDPVCPASASLDLQGAKGKGARVLCALNGGTYHRMSSSSRNAKHAVICPISREEVPRPCRTTLETSWLSKLSPLVAASSPGLGLFSADLWCHDIHP
jgi:hypothetical protein